MRLLRSFCALHRVPCTAVAEIALVVALSRPDFQDLVRGWQTARLARRRASRNRRQRLWRNKHVL